MVELVKWHVDLKVSIHTLEKTKVTVSFWSRLEVYIVNCNITHPKAAFTCGPNFEHLNFVVTTVPVRMSLT